jgi:flagellar basal-body rod protein FlgF
MRPANTLPGPKPVKFVIDRSVGRDFGQGALQSTGATFDLGLEGEGFFRVNTPEGERYTRNGRFTLDPAGRLVTMAGQPVLDDGGGEIVIDTERGRVSIAADGTVSQGEERVAKVGVGRFQELSVLAKVGDNLYRNTSNQQPQAAAAAKVRQGMLEGSNVQPIREITRAYESVAKMMDATSELSRRSIERMGRVQ